MRCTIRKLASTQAALLLLAASGCMVGPHYKRPSAPMTPAFKEPPPDGWKEAQPNDGVLKGKWWEMYNDPTLNNLVEQVAISNQNVLSAEAQYRAARAAVGIARSALFPSVSVGPAVNANAAVGVHTVTYTLPAQASWTADLWGSIRRSVTAAQETAQGNFATLENARLSYQAELAQDYFQLHGTDSDIELLERTVKSYQEYLTLTKNRFNAGVASGADVAQAETQLETTRAQLIDLQQTRAQFEHAIAVLTGKPPAELTLASQILKDPPPVIPLTVPSALLERRPDIAASERQMAATYEQIGIAMAAYYPTLSLTGGAGFGATKFTQSFWPARFFTLGGALSETVFDAGKRRSQVAQEQALFDVNVANYRQTVLTAFQQVEDDLAALRVYEREAEAIRLAVKAAEDALRISTAQYKAGTVAYLQVITSQAAALNAERSAIDLLARRLVSSVMLIEALGGGWSTAEMPSTSEVSHTK